MKNIWWLLAIPAILIAAWFATRGRSTVVEVKVAKPRRETLISNLPTNGKVEPIEWTAVRVETPGLVVRLPVHQGDTIQKGALLAQVSETGLAEQLHEAQARVAQVQAELDTLSKGGRTAELTEIDNSLAKARFDRDTGNKEYGSLQRLQEKQAATMVEVANARDKVRQAELAIEALQRRRAAIVGTNDIAGTQARLREAQAAEKLAQIRLGQGTIRAPMTGVVYDLPARMGTYLNAGDLVASVGRVTALRVRVYVDEPELGRVAVGQPVKITWDALRGKSWMGKVERMPTQIAALGTRQVGEVLCAIDNPGRELVPGTNVNADIETSVMESALTIPNEALHREGGAVNVFVVDADNIAHMRKVQTGAANVTRSQIVGGLKDGELVALPGDRALKDGEKVKPLDQ